MWAQDFGAKFDGARLDLPAINGAIDYAHVQGGGIGRQKHALEEQLGDVASNYLKHRPYAAPMLTAKTGLYAEAPWHTLPENRVSTRRSRIA